MNVEDLKERFMLKGYPGVQVHVDEQFVGKKMLIPIAEKQ